MESSVVKHTQLFFVHQKSGISQVESKNFATLKQDVASLQVCYRDINLEAVLDIAVNGNSSARESASFKHFIMLREV